jgi:predicted permease
VSQVLPILFIFLSGYIFKKFHRDSSKELIDIVLYFIFPLFIIYKVHFLEFSDDITLVVSFALIAFILGILFAYIFAKIFKINANSATMIAMSVAYGNTSFLGFAFVDSYYGSYALSLAIFYDQVNMLLLALLAPLVCSFGNADEKSSLKKTFISVVTFPPTIAFVIALATKGIVFPEVVTLFLQKVSFVLVPIIMFAIGMRFELSDIRGKEKEISIIILISMVLIPLTLYMGSFLLLENSISLKVSIMEAAMPPMVLATVTAIKSGLDEKLGMGALGVGMILSFISIPIVFYLLG